MPPWSTVLAFSAATVALLLIPGPAVFYTLNRSLADGRRVGLAGVAGLEVGDAIQATFAALGLSAVLATSASLFNVVKWAGAVYLIVLGIKTLRQRPTPVDTALASMPVGRAFRHGVLVNALNPKTALFFLSIFPQFVDPRAANAGTQSLVLGAVFVALAAVFNGTFSLCASAMRPVLLRGRAVPFVQRYVSGGMYVGLGLLAAPAGHTSAGARGR